MKNWKLPMLFNTPLRLIIALGLFILASEFFIMTVIGDALSSMNVPDVYWNFIDSILLTIIISPALYSLVFLKLQSEGRFRQINASAQDAIVIVDEQGRLTDWNPAAQRMFQYSREEALGQQMHQLLAPPRDRADADRGFAQFQKTGEGPLVGKIREVTAIRKDGSEFPIEIYVSALKEKGRWHAVGIMRDITERMRAEDKLRESEEKFSMIFESNPAMVAIGTLDGKIVDVNLSYADFLGFSRKEMIGKNLADLGIISVKELQRLLELCQCSGASLRNVEVSLRARGGSIFNALLSADLVLLGGVPYRLATLQDITARKQAETQIAEQLDELRRWYDATSGREGRVLNLKHEVNELLAQAGQPPRYPSAEADDGRHPIV